MLKLDTEALVENFPAIRGVEHSSFACSSAASCVEDLARRPTHSVRTVDVPDMWMTDDARVALGLLSGVGNYPEEYRPTHEIV